jgi:superfamily II DNA or RNA helicase
MTKNHYIYLLYDVKNPTKFLSFETNKICRKIGSTCNMKSRMKSYLTGHPDKVPVECYYHIKNPELYTCYQIDNMIKIKYDNYRIKGNGGIEFYESNKVTQEVIEEYFNQNNIIWEKIYEIIDEDYNFTSEDWDNLKYDNEHRILLTKSYNLLTEYINKIKERDIIKELIATNEDLFNYLLQYYDDTHILYLKDKLINDQIEVLLSSILYFKYNDKGIWNLFCRYGKTRLSSLYCKVQNYKKILILVPSLYLINQTYETWVNYYSKELFKIICSKKINEKGKYIKNDDISEKDILKFYNSTETTIFISTYHSSQKLDKLYFDICIYDEAHRTTGLKLKEEETSSEENINSEENKSYYKRQLESKHINKKLFLTATTKEYTGGEDDYYSMDDENIYGKIIAVVSAKKAKDLNRICDYKILTIELTPIEISIDIEEFFQKNNINKPEDKQKINKLKDKYVMCAVGLYETMKKEKIKHVITFHELIINCIFFKTILNKICNYNVNNIDGNTPNRKEIINNFQDIDYSILCSAKVLQEGVDIPKCDGVIFIDIKESIIDTVQSLSRCLTRVDDNPDKNGHIMIPYDDRTDLLNDEYTNNLRIILRNIVEIDDNLKGFFKDILILGSGSLTEGDIMKLEELKIKYNIHVNSNIIKEIREISYVTFYTAKKIIAGKYNHSNDYMNNVQNDFSDPNTNLPINANIIYAKFGWKGWNDYLGLSNEMSLYRISNIMKNENEHRLKMLNSKLKIKDAIKYILITENREMYSEEIYNKILESKICSFNCIDKKFSIDHNCGYLVKDNVINMNDNYKPRKYYYNGYNAYELIDTKQKYIEYCINKAPDLPQDIEPEDGNWIKFLLKNYDELVESHYKSNELKDIFTELKISNQEEYIEQSKNNNKFINYDYISNGFYEGLNINTIYFIKTKRRF